MAMASLLSVLSPRGRSTPKHGAMTPTGAAAAAAAAGIVMPPTPVNSFVDRATLSAVMHDCLDQILIPVLIPIILEYGNSHRVMVCTGSSDDSCRSIITIKVLANPNLSAADDDIVVCETWNIKPSDSKESNTSSSSTPTAAASSSLSSSSANSTARSSIFSDRVTVQTPFPRTFGHTSAASAQSYRDSDGDIVTPVLAKTQHYTSTSAILGGHYLYVAGGWTLGSTPQIVRTVHRWSLLDGTDQECAPMHQPRRGLVSAVVDRKWIVHGGSAALMEKSETNDSDTSSEWYSAEKDKWYCDIPATSVGHACGGSAILSGRMVLFGGLSWDTVESWDPRAGERTWTKHSCMPYPNHYGFGVCTPNDHTAIIMGGYVLNGTAPDSVKSILAAFDIRMNRWSLLHDMPLGLVDTHAVRASQQALAAATAPSQQSSVSSSSSALPPLPPPAQSPPAASSSSLKKSSSLLSSLVALASPRLSISTSTSSLNLASPRGGPEPTSILEAKWPPLPSSMCYVTSQYLSNHIIIAGGTGHKNSATMYTLRCNAAGMPVPGEQWREYFGSHPHCGLNVWQVIGSRSGMASVCL